MAIRDHVDAAGTHWQVWMVVPTGRTAASASVKEERRARSQEPFAGTDRRRKTFTLTPGMEDGWLCFESGGEKRRLAPVPDGWESCSPEVLDGYLARARPVSRRIIEQSSDSPRANASDAR